MLTFGPGRTREKEGFPEQWDADEARRKAPAATSSRGPRSPFPAGRHDSFISPKALYAFIQSPASKLFPSSPLRSILLSLKLSFHSTGNISSSSRNIRGEIQHWSVNSAPVAASFIHFQNSFRHNKHLHMGIYRY